MAEKKKRKGRGFLIFLIIFTVLIVLPVGTAYILIEDKSTTKETYYENFDKNEALNTALVESFDSTKENKEINFRVSQTLLNNMIKIAVEEKLDHLDPMIKGILKGMDVEIKENEYHFHVYINWSFITTKFTLKTKLEQGKIDNENAFIFTIIDLKFGKIPGLYGMLKDALTAFVNDSMLEGFFSAAGLSIHSNIANNRLYYKENDIYNDFASHMGGSSDALISHLLTTCKENNLFTYDLCSNKSISAKINLANSVKNDNYLETTRYVDTGLDAIDTKIETLLNNGVCTKNTLATFNSYLLRGYDSLSSSDRTTIDNANLESIEITDKAGYLAPFRHQDSGFNQKIANQTNTILLPTQVEGTLVTLSEADLEGAIKDGDILGEHYQFAGKPLGSNTYKSNYIVMDNVQVNIVNNKMFFSIGLNVNGLETYMILVLNQDTTYTETGKAKFTIEKTLYGEIDCSASLDSYICDILAHSVSGAGWASFDKPTKTLIIDVMQNVDPVAKTAIIASGKTISLATKGENVSSSGTFELIAE